MADLGTLLFAFWTALLPLAALFLVVWIVFVAVLEIYRALRSAIPQHGERTNFILTEAGETLWLAEARDAPSPSSSAGEKWLRLSVHFACGMEAAFVLFLAAFLFRHSNPHGDGMEMAGVGFAFMLIFLPFTLPAFILARLGRWLVFAAVLAALGAFAYFGLWLEMLNELGLGYSLP